MANQRIMHDIDLAKVGQIIDARIQNVTAAEKSALAGTLGAGNAGLFVYDTDDEALNIWDGATFRTVSPDITGDVIFKGLINPTNAATIAADASLAQGHQYIVDTAGTLTATGVTFTPTADVEVGDMVLWTSTTTASVINKNFNEATETESGTVELATQAEVDAGTDTERAVTPATLAGSQLSDDVDTNETDIAALEAKIGESGGAYLTLDTTSQTVIEAINELRTNLLLDSDEVASNDSDLSVLAGRMTSAEGRLDGHDTDISDLQSVDAAQTVRLDSADTRFVAVEGRVTQNEADVLALQGADSDLDARLDTVESRLDSADLRFVAAETRVSAVEGRLDSADTRFIAAETRISANESAISALEGADSDFSVRMDSADARLVTIEGRLDGHDTDITALQGVDSDIKEFVGFSETLDTSATTLVGAVNELHGEINDNDSDIAALDGRVTNLEGRDNVKSYTDTNVSLTANTPATINHAMSLVDKHDFIIHVMNSVGSAISFDVDAIDANNITLTSDVTLTGAQVFMLGQIGAGSGGGTPPAPSVPAGAFMLQDESGYLTTEDGDALTIENP
jgi:predicted  nucleic acid-binding Zn-ribbon protein